MNMNKKAGIALITLATVMAGTLSAQATTYPGKSKSVLEARRVQPPTITTEEVEKFETVVIVGESEPPASVKDFKSESHFRNAYNSLLQSYLDEYERSNREWVEMNSKLDIAKAHSLAEIQNKNFSKAYNATEIDFMKTELRAILEKNVEETRAAKLAELQANYNSRIAALDAKKTALDSAFQSTEFIIDVDLCISKYDSIGKNWKIKVSSTNPDAKFSTDWLTLKLDREALEEQFEFIAPKIEAGLCGKAYYSMYISLLPDEPEDMTRYDRRVTRIELFDKSGKSIGVFPVDISAGSYEWYSYKKQVFVD